MSNFVQVYESVSRTNGASYNVSTGKLNPHNGYMVAMSGYDWTTPHPQYMTLEEFQLLVQTYLKQMGVWNKINGDANVFIGIWGVNNTLVFDLSVHIKDKEEALAYADKHKQQAIWDCLAGKEIYPSHKLI